MTAGPFWAEPADAVLRSVNSTAAGLSSEAAQAALGRVGPNRIRAEARVTAAVMLLTLGLPYSPLARVLGFTPLPLLYLLFIFGIVALYLTAAELTKRWFYRRYGAGGREAATGGL